MSSWNCNACGAINKDRFSSCQHCTGKPWFAIIDGQQRYTRKGIDSATRGAVGPFATRAEARVFLLAEEDTE